MTGTIAVLSLPIGVLSLPLVSFEAAMVVVVGWFLPVLPIPLVG